MEELHDEDRQIKKLEEHRDLKSPPKGTRSVF